MRAEYVIETEGRESRIHLHRTKNNHELEIKIVGAEDAIVFVKLRDLLDAAGALAGEWWAEYEKTALAYLNTSDSMEPEGGWDGQDT